MGHTTLNVTSTSYEVGIEPIIKGRRNAVKRLRGAQLGEKP
nr:hypothetical protein [Candidatus Freyrarchaeum guaymaensis]